MTAVEWLVEQCFPIMKNTPPLLQIIEQALEMERQQIIDAYAKGMIEESESDYVGMNEEINAEIYYNKTYKKTT